MTFNSLHFLMAVSIPSAKMRASFKVFKGFFLLINL